jgi:hypothetical protein
MTDAVRPLPDLDGVEIHGHTDGVGSNVTWDLRPLSVEGAIFP